MTKRILFNFIWPLVPMLCYIQHLLFDANLLPRSLKVFVSWYLLSHSNIDHTWFWCIGWISKSIASSHLLELKSFTIAHRSDCTRERERERERERDLVGKRSLERERELVGERKRSCWKEIIGERKRACWREKESLLERERDLFG